MSREDRGHRGTIHVEEAAVIDVQTYPDEQYVMRIRSAKCAATAAPGSFIHLRCDDRIPMRRPLSIMRASPQQGWVEVLFKTVGSGLAALAEKQPGDLLSSMGPIGRGFVPDKKRPHSLLIGGGVGIPPMVFLAEHLKNDAGRWQPLVLMGSEIPFPFELCNSSAPVAGIDDSVNRSIALLEDWQVPARLASLSDYDGTYRGYVTELADRHLQSLSNDELARTEIFSCGPTPMLEAVARLAEKHKLPAQVSLEEFMACAVGGCAGCTVEVTTPDGPAMRRVCVDGPVFSAASVFPPGT